MADWNWCQFGRDGVAVGGAAGDDQIRGVAGVEEGETLYSVRWPLSPARTTITSAGCGSSSSTSQCPAKRVPAVGKPRRRMAERRARSSSGRRGAAATIFLTANFLFRARRRPVIQFRGSIWGGTRDIRLLSRITAEYHDLL